MSKYHPLYPLTADILYAVGRVAVGRRAALPGVRTIATHGLAFLVVHEWAEATHNSADGLVDADPQNVADGEAVSAIGQDAGANMRARKVAEKVVRGRIGGGNRIRAAGTC